MKHLTKTILVLSLLFLSKNVVAQTSENEYQLTYSNKGKLYFYWGWNKSIYSRSNIHFTGNDYNFTLDKVKATDAPYPLSWDYIHPKRMTIPQYNFRIGYFFKDNWSISFGNDHMKYVVVNGKNTKISGNINIDGSPYEGSYDNESINISPDFLKFEHTDGLNYENIELRHFSTLAENGKLRLQLIEGVGAGILLPKTNSTLLGMERNDEFHFSGFGASAVIGLQADYKGGFFIQAEAKGGYVNMYDIVTTKHKADRASQSFFFFQYNIVFGYKFQLIN